MNTNTTIKGQGSSTISPNFHCTWYTTNGSTSTITITNSGSENTLTFDVSGAPETISAVGPNGEIKKFNDRWTIPPGESKGQVKAFGNFMGTVVSIMNQSDPSTTCQIDTTVT